MMIEILTRDKTKVQKGCYTSSESPKRKHHRVRSSVSKSSPISKEIEAKDLGSGLI